MPTSCCDSPSITRCPNQSGDVSSGNVFMNARLCCATVCATSCRRTPCCAAKSAGSVASNLSTRRGAGMNSKTPIHSLEYDSSGQLHRTRLVGLRGDQAEGRIGRRQLGELERRVIEQVEGLEPKLEVTPSTIGEVDILQHRRVDLVGAVAAQAGERGRKCADVIRELIGGPRVERAGVERQPVGLARIEVQFVPEIDQVADGGG